MTDAGVRSGLAGHRQAPRPPLAWALQIALLAAAAALVAGCSALTTRPDAAWPPFARVAAREANAPPAAAAAGSKPFVEVIAGATELRGLLPLWRKDEKVWIELAPEQFGRPLFLAINLSRGVGERRLLAGMMGNPFSAGGAFLVEFRRIGPQVQLIARNTRFTAAPGSAEERAVARAFSDSLLASVPVASQPHPERGSVLVDANALLLADIPRGVYAIERAYRNHFTFDAKNSYFTEVRSGDQQTTLDVNAHYALARLPLPSTVPGATPFFPPPEVIEDPRSLFLGFLYSFSRLPEQPMRPRLADPRLGYFRTGKLDFSNERRPSPNVWFIQRWRLEKKEPAAELSEPVKPIVFWLDREIPERYRPPIAAGILEWNKAFERIGIRDAIRVRVQAAGESFDTADTLHASVRWMTTAAPSFAAHGPSHVDPRSGEILDADIGIDASVTRVMRYFRAEAIGEAAAAMYTEAGLPRPEALGVDASDARACGYAALSAREHGFALAMLEARGAIDPEGPEAEAFVAQYLKDVMMHETGHALGLMHNFHGSTAYTRVELADPEFTAQHGIAGSVMDYLPFNLAAKGERQGAYGMNTLGAYDYWAIEFAYRPLPAESEAEELARIAARSIEPKLAYASDFDVVETLDPEVNQFDLGADALLYYRKRLALSRELWERLEKRQLPPGESYSMLRRRFLTGFGQIGIAMGLAAKYVGGATYVRDFAGTPRAPITPVPAARQREALALIAEGLLAVDSFRLSPDFLRRLAPDPLERESVWPPRADSTVVALPDMVISLQRDVLNRLLSPAVAQRLLVNEAQVDDRGQALSLAELYATVQAAIWSEVAAEKDVGVLRRNLQREHLRRVASALLAPTAALPADARALHRLNARRLREQLASAVQRSGLAMETQAHYTEALDTLNDALEASLLRSGA